MALRGWLTTYKLTGGTKAIKIWRNLDIANNPTGAVSRMLLIDTKGEIPPNELCEWLDEIEARRKIWEDHQKSN